MFVRQVDNRLKIGRKFLIDYSFNVLIDYAEVQDFPRGKRHTSVLLELLHTSSYSFILLHTSLYFSKLLRTSRYLFVLIHTSPYSFVFLHTSSYFSILFGTSWYFLVLLRTSCVQKYAFSPLWFSLSSRVINVYCAQLQLCALSSFEPLTAVTWQIGSACDPLEYDF